jgi:lipoprotein-releasing system permease protein
VHRIRPGLLIFFAARLLLHARLSAVMLVLAVALGIAFQIPNTANMDGYTDELIRQGVLRSTGHVLVAPRGGAYHLGAAALCERLRAVPGVRQVTPRLFHAGVILRQAEPRAVRLVAIDPAGEDAANRLASRLRAGRMPDPEERRQALLGARLAGSLGLAVGDAFDLVIPTGDLRDADAKKVKLHVVGILGGGGGFSEDSDLLTSFATLEHELGQHDRASAILVYGDDARRAESLAAAVARSLPDTVARAWQEEAVFVGQAIKGNHKLAAVALLMGTLSVAIPVLALLFVHVLTERRQIAIVRSLGLRVGEVFAVYLLKAVMVAGVGVVLGVGLGLALCDHFQRTPIFQSDGFVVRPVLHLASIAGPCLVVCAAAVLAGVLPAISAARTNPAEQLQRG